MPTDQRTDIDLFAPVANPPTWGSYLGTSYDQSNWLYQWWLKSGLTTCIEGEPADRVRGISGSAVDFARDMMRLDDIATIDAVAHGTEALTWREHVADLEAERREDT